MKTKKENFKLLNVMLESMSENDNYFFINHEKAVEIMRGEKELIKALDLLQRKAALTADRLGKYSNGWQVYLIPKKAAYRFVKLYDNLLLKGKK